MGLLDSIYASMNGKEDTIKIYKDNKGEYRWHRKSTNGKTVGASTEGYLNRADCLANLERQFVKPDNDSY